MLANRQRLKMPRPIERQTNANDLPDMQIIFEKVWITGEGWEDTDIQPGEFDKIIELTTPDENGCIIFMGLSAFGEQHILKGKIETT